MAQMNSKKTGLASAQAQMLLCFTSGTMIETPSGERSAERLKVGDMVWTADKGPQAIRWLHRRSITRAEMRADAALRPVLFAPDALGRGTPTRPLRVSPQHRVCVTGWKAQQFFGAREVLVPAIDLVDGAKITQGLPSEDVTYVHFLLDGHQIVRSNGMLSESFHPAEAVIRQMDARTREELLWLFPDALDADGRFASTARPVAAAGAVQLVA